MACLPLVLTYSRLILALPLAFPPHLAPPQSCGPQDLTLQASSQGSRPKSQAQCHYLAQHQSPSLHADTQGPPGSWLPSFAASHFSPPQPSGLQIPGVTLVSGPVLFLDNFGNPPWPYPSSSHAPKPGPTPRPQSPIHPRTQQISQAPFFNPIPWRPLLQG